MGSKRLPGKVMKNLLGMPMIMWQINSLKKLGLPIIIATTTNRLDDVIHTWAANEKLLCVRDSEENVFNRFRKVIQMYPAKNYIRVTGDCPLISPFVTRKLLNTHTNIQADYSSNTLLRSFPDGLDVEVFTHEAFLKLQEMSLTKYQTEHVTAAFYQHPEMFSVANLLEERNLGNWRWTIDFQSDFTWLEGILGAMTVSEVPEYEKILEFIVNYPAFKRTQEDVIYV